MGVVADLDEDTVQVLRGRLVILVIWVWKRESDGVVWKGMG